MGIGRLRLIDSECFEEANVHRHALGVRHIGRSKAIALAEELGGRYPHLAFEPENATVEAVLAKNEDFLFGTDLVVFATGEETLERRLNGLLPAELQRVHAWVEPLGLAGHVLLHARDAPGCYECLFQTKGELGLVNMAALTGWGQTIQQSLGGCAGTFTPFSALDARRTALEAARLVGKTLLGKLATNEIATWRGSDDSFEEQGLRLSQRASEIPRGCLVSVAGERFAMLGCPVCGIRPAPMSVGIPK